MYRIELMDKQGRARIEALVCMLCGEILDPVIERNRSGVIEKGTFKPASPERQSSYAQAAQ